MTSAVRVGGERLYRKAHRGEIVETPERDVEVYRAELLADDADSATYEIECSAGTYVRTLIEALGDAYCSALRRTAIGPFEVEDAGEELSLGRVAELVPGAVLRERGTASIHIWFSSPGAEREADGKHRGDSAPRRRAAAARTSRSEPSTGSTSATGR